MRMKALLAGLSALALLSCSGGGPTEPGNGSTVSVQNNFFSPASIEVPANTTVTWNWNSAGVVHDVTFDDGEHSERMGSGSFTRTFTTTGSFPYHCTVHGLSMSGTVTVTAPASMAATASR